MAETFLMGEAWGPVWLLVMTFDGETTREHTLPLVGFDDDNGNPVVVTPSGRAEQVQALPGAGHNADGSQQVRVTALVCPEMGNDWSYPCVLARANRALREAWHTAYGSDADAGEKAPA